ncbi:uncharacterized protein LOC130722825 [Lotus japonicus]|uniref:uncharacterized protein LOC130722825 n=1 Tax=Lotus japonicus TaxID=34305 RepID=UPI0025838FA3|nr:uncharacterized protein LOC130722825 [Lotus japonicus]
MIKIKSYFYSAPYGSTFDLHRTFHNHWQPPKPTFAVVATPIRLWVVPSFYGKKLPYSMDLVLMDAKGCKIHAFVTQSLIYKFQALLNEGCVYHIFFFGVGENGGNFRTTSHAKS